jgi:hypothetical protein
MIGAGLSSTETPAGAFCTPHRTIRRPAIARRAATASSHGGRESRSGADSGVGCSSCTAAAAGTNVVDRTSVRATGWELERRETESGATTVAATGRVGRRRLRLRVVESSRVAGRRAAGAAFPPILLALLARRRESTSDEMAAGAAPRGNSIGDVTSSSTSCPPIEAGCCSGAGASGTDGAGTAGVSRGGSNVIGST